MKSKEESSFLQGVESRLDSLFAEDPQSSTQKDTEPVRATNEESAPDEAQVAREDIREPVEVRETIPLTEVSAEPSPAPDKSTFISEIEKRFSAIFGDDDKDASPVSAAQEPDDLKKTVSQLPPAETERTSPLLEDISSPPASILLSPLKDMKSIILSIEWEINDSILEQLEDEINKLYLLYTGDRVVQGFLRILRFLGRYVRVRGVRSNQDSINLLLFVYDHLENVMVSDGMTEAKKNIILLDNIKKYRDWVASTDLEIPDEREVPETIDGTLESSGMQTWEKISFEEIKGDMQPAQHSIEVKGFEEESITGTSFEQLTQDTFSAAPEAEPAGQEPAAEVIRDPMMEEERAPLEIKREEIETNEKAASFVLDDSAIRSFERISNVKEEAGDAPAVPKELPSHEAFASALEEIKKNFRSELDALKEEIRILKSTREQRTDTE